MAKNTDCISVAELAERIQKSRQWIYTLVNKDPELRKYVVMSNGRKMFRKAVIAEYFQQEVEKPEDELVTLLREQLAAANKQIEELTEALKREQFLHGQTAARLQQLMIEDKQKPAPRPEQAKAAPRRKGLRGLFGL